MTGAKLLLNARITARDRAAGRDEWFGDWPSADDLQKIVKLKRVRSAILKSRPLTVRTAKKERLNRH